MVLGICSAVLFVLAVSAPLATRLPAASALRRAAVLAHRPLGYGFLALSALHLALSFRLFSQRPLALYLAGFAMVACAAFACVSQRVFRRDRKRGLLVHKACALVLALLLGVHVAVCVGSFAAYQREVAAITIGGTSAAQVPDGTYFGACDVGYIRASVEVSVQDGRIVSIGLLEHKNERGAPGEGVIPRMLEAQTTDVDAVSGATNSSRVIQKAVENALLAP